MGLGIRTGPDPAARHIGDLRQGQAPAVGHLFQEIGIDHIRFMIERRPLVGGEGLDRRIHQRVLADGDFVHLHPDQIGRAPEADLAGQNPDRAGQRRRFGDDAVGAGGNIIAAGGAQFAMLTTTGLPAFCAFFTASRIWSEAVTEPPGNPPAERWP